LEYFFPKKINWRILFVSKKFTFPCDMENV